MKNIKNKIKKGLNRQIFELIAVFMLLIPLMASSFVPQEADAAFLNINKVKDIFSSSDVFLNNDGESFPEVSDINPRRTVWMTMTAYSSDVGQTDSTPCLPADSSYNLCEHYEENGAQDTIAVNFLALGTKVRFPDLYGDKIFVVRDRMNVRYGFARGDFWMPERSLAKKFGVKRVKMEIYYR